VFLHESLEQPSRLRRLGMQVGVVGLRRPDQAGEQCEPDEEDELPERTGVPARDGEVFDIVVLAVPPGAIAMNIEPGDAVVVGVDGGYTHEFTTAQVHYFL